MNFTPLFFKDIPRFSINNLDFENKVYWLLLYNQTDDKVLLSYYNPSVNVIIRNGSFGFTMSDLYRVYDVTISYNIVILEGNNLTSYNEVRFFLRNITKDSITVSFKMFDGKRKDIIIPPTAFSEVSIQSYGTKRIILDKLYDE